MFVVLVRSRLIIYLDHHRASTLLFWNCQNMGCRGQGEGDGRGDGGGEVRWCGRRYPPENNSKGGNWLTKGLSSVCACVARVLTPTTRHLATALPTRPLSNRFRSRAFNLRRQTRAAASGRSDDRWVAVNMASLISG